MRKSQIPVLFFFTLVSLPVLAQVACPTVNPITVTRTTGSAGTTGSLPWALNCLNNVTTLTTVQFNITGAGPHIIQPGANSPLPTITKANAHIDGSTDNIVIDGTLDQSQAIVVSANAVKINGLTIRNFDGATFSNAIRFTTGNGHEVNSCQLFDNQNGISIARSVGTFSINLNYIGTDKSNTNFSNNAAGITVETFAGAAGPPTGTINNNTIGFNAVGIQVGTARNVTISQNSIFCNTKLGIERASTIATPTISSATTRQITGTAPASSSVQVFRVNNTGCTNVPCQGRTYLGTVTTNAFGAWNLNITAGLSANDQVTATMTQASNTSEFSACRTVVDICANFLASIKSNNVTCNNGNNGSASVSTSGGLNQGIRFVWSTGATTSAISNLSAGTYRVTATDAAACESIQSVNILQPTAITIRTTVTNVPCNGDKAGQITTTTTGGVAPYTYRWSNGATTANIGSLIAGTYMLTVTDASNCTATAQATVAQPAVLAANLIATDTLCPGAKNGTAQSSPSGGTAPYTFLWSTGATTTSISGLGAGNYSLRVTDQMRCQVIVNFPIFEFTALRVDTSVIHPKCVGDANGEIALKVSGGKGPYTYFWENGATTATRSNLKAGTYKVEVTDANRCSVTLLFTIKDPTPINVQIITTDPPCLGLNTGTAKVDVIGGTGPFTYLWSTGATTTSIEMLSAGRYSLTVTNGNACKGTFPFTINAATTVVQLSTNTVDVACFGGTTGEIRTTTTGGKEPYMYKWSTGATSVDLLNLKAGLYGLTVTDQGGCADTARMEVKQAAVINIDLQVKDTLCAGQKDGTAIATVTGGAGTYAYLWSTGATTTGIANLGVGTYGLTVTDRTQCQQTRPFQIIESTPLSIDSTLIDPKCNADTSGEISIRITGGTAPYRYAWENGATTANRKNLKAGNYNVVVSDANGCTATWSFVLNDPAPINARVITTDPLCFGLNTGTARVDLLSTGPHTFLWSTGATASTIQNLGAGNYGLTVTNAIGCKASFPFTIIGPPTDLQVQLRGVDINCFGANSGEIRSTTTGGQQTYGYKWSTGATSADLLNLTAGTYALTVTDQNGCADTASVMIKQNPAISSTTTFSNPACFGQSNGQATVLASGGSPGYRYVWSTGASTSAISGLAAGKFIVSITDVLGCLKKDSVLIVSPAQLFATATATNANCNGTATGSAQVVVTGGTSPYAYNWSTGATSSAINNLSANTYGVTVSDSRTCQVTASVTVTQPSALRLVLNTTDIPCTETNSGRATAQVTGGTAPYRYAWSNGASTSALSNLPPGEYGLTVTDAAGCQVNDSKTIRSAARLNLQMSSTNILCNGQTNGQAAVVVSGGTSPYTYLWSTGATSSAITNLATGNYRVTVTDVAGCNENGNTPVSEPPALTVTVTPTNLLCNGQNQGQALAAAGGGTAPYAYRWSNGATTSSISGLAAGNYSLTITDANQCTRTQNFSISEPSALQVNTTFTRETSPNANNGTATASVSGGTSPYRYRWSNGASTSALNNLAQGLYTVTVEDANGCTSVKSGAVGGDNCPALSVSGIATDLNCSGGATGAIILTVVGGTTPYFYAWSNGATTADLDELNEGTYSVTVSDANGCTGNYSTTLKAGKSMPKPLYGIVAPDTVCGNEIFTLRADDLFQGPNVTYVWQLPNGEELYSSTPSLKLKATSSAFSGEYSALRDSAGCQSSTFGPVIVDVISLPPNTFSAGRDTTICNGSTSITLKAQRPTTGRASWLPLSNRIILQNPNSPNATAQNLGTGANRFVWRIAIGRCIQAAADTVTVFLEKAPQLADDKYTIERSQDIAAMNILLNDNLAGLQDTTITWSGAPTMGNFEFIPGNKSFRYTAEADFKGVIEFKYTVCNEASQCATPCDSANVSVEIFNLPKPTEGLVLEDAGPNGTLQIRGLQGYSRVDIVITNRWGDLVYKNPSYDNAAPWRGQAGDNGPYLPPGAYYYVIRAYDNESLVGKPQTGAIYLFKKENP